MKGQFRGFVSGFLVALLLFGLIGSAIAVGRQEQATLDYPGIKITLDGKEIIPRDAKGNPLEPFAIKGTIYLPVRAIADALGVSIAWDATTQTAKMTTTKPPVAIPAPTPSSGNTFISVYPFSNVPMLENEVSVKFTESSEHSGTFIYKYPLTQFPAIDETDDDNYMTRYIARIHDFEFSIEDGSAAKDSRCLMIGRSKSNVNQGMAMYEGTRWLYIVVGDVSVNPFLSEQSPSPASTSNPNPTPTQRPTPAPTPRPTPTPTSRPIPASTPKPTETPNHGIGSMVWVSRTGSKYHNSSICSNMKNPSLIPLSEAQARGLTPCSKCCK